MSVVGRQHQAGGRGLRAVDRDLVERLVQLRGERRLIGEERERIAEAAPRPAAAPYPAACRRCRCSFFRIQCFTCAPRLVKTILYCSFSTVVSVSTRRCNGRSGARGACTGPALPTGGCLRRRLLGRLRLRLGLRCVGAAGVRRRRLGLEEVLVAEEHHEHQQREGHHGAHIAAAATAAGALRLKIRILNFGQRILPVVQKRQAVRPPLFSMVMVRGENGLACGSLAGGTGSRPPRAKGMAAQQPPESQPRPRSGPCVAMATAAYSEQVGR